MSMRSLLPKALLIGALATLVVACSEDTPAPPAPAPAPDPIVLGTVYNVTGAQAVLDVPSSNGSVLAASQINARGGVLGRDLKLVEVEGDSVPGTLVGETEKLLSGDDDVIALLGLSDTDMVLEAAPVAATHGRVLLTSGATSPKLPEQIHDYLYLACFGDNVQAAAGAEWAYNELLARNVLVLFEPDRSYPTLLQGYFVARFEELGGTVSADESLDSNADTIKVTVPEGTDLVYLSVETAEDAARFVPMLRAAGYSGPILGGDGYDAEAVWAQHPEIGDVYFTTHAYMGTNNPNPQTVAFVKAYEEAYPGQAPSAFSALGYDAVGLLAAAIERSGQPTPEGIMAGLAGLSDYKGATGTISFKNGDRIPTKSVTLMKVSGGKQGFIKEVMPQSVPAP